MMTLEQFQREVLQPLRDKRDEEYNRLNATYREVMEKTAKTKADLEATECNFYAAQAAKKIEFEASQRIELQKFKTEMRNSRLKIHNQQHEVLQNIKEMKRRVFDEHNDAVGRAFAEFNAERAKNGELPVTCNEIKKFNEEEANYDRD